MFRRSSGTGRCTGSCIPEAKSLYFFCRTPFRTEPFFPASERTMNFIDDLPGEE